jgi:class 3 adenylate cyclase
VPSAPEIRFARAGDVNVAYQVIGRGPPDVVFVPGWISNIEVMWELAEFARFLDRLASFGRLIVFDKRGVGVSDRTSGAVTLEERMDDVRAVLDAVGSTRAAMIGWADGAALVALFAATYPERVEALVLGAVAATFGEGATPPGLTEAARGELVRAAATEAWGSADFLSILAPSAADDPRVVAFWRRYERLAASPNAATSMLRLMLELDVRAALPLVQVPTLVVQRKDMLTVTSAAARWVADQIPRGRFVELEGRDTLPYIGDSEALLDEIEEFLTGSRGHVDIDRALATVMFTDIVDSTGHASRLGDLAWRDRLDAHNAEVRRALSRFDGQEIDTAGDGFLAVFDGPARAVRCACAIRESVKDAGVEIRVGLHVGEVQQRENNVTGLGVHVGARLVALARPSEVVVTQTVKDLVLGSGIIFTDRGVHTLKGVEGAWHLYAVAD